MTKLTRILKEAEKLRLMDEIKSSQDFNLLVDVLSSLISSLSAQADAIEAQKNEIVTEVKQMVPEKGLTGERGPKGDRGERGERGPAGKDGKNGRDGRDGRDGVDGKDGESIVGPAGQDGKDGSPDTGLQIVEKINELPTDEDKYLIDIKHINGLLKELKELRKLATAVTYVGGGSSGGGRIVKSYDISSQLNGVLKTFSLPAFWRVISVHSSSFPGAFRETIDYTTDANASTITFTSEIEASATLQSGQSIIVLYSE